MKQRFLICEHCKNIITMVDDKGVAVMCCGQKMTELIPGTVDAAVEKHTPVYTVENNKVKVTVGSVEHPMTEQHLIEWVCVQTNKGVYRKELKADTTPSVCFSLCEDETVEAVYAYCNLHGLWMA